MTKKHVLILCAALVLIATGNFRIGAAQALVSPEAAVAPTITTQPANATVKLGEKATFTVVASGTAPLQYQWYHSFDSPPMPINGATASRYTIPASAEWNGEGVYVIVTNSAGSVQSNNAILTVVDPPVICGQPSSVTVTLPAFVTFNACASGTYPLTCQWNENGHAISGATDCYSYATPEITMADNGAAFTLTAKNFAGSATSKAAILTVKASTPAGAYPIVGNWSGTATTTNPASGTTTSQVVAAFSQTSYSITGTFVYTDDSGIPLYGVGVASLNGLNLYATAGGDPTVGIAGGFSADLLTLHIIAGGAGLMGGSSPDSFDDSVAGGSGTLTLSADHNTLTGTGTDTDGDTIAWRLTREN
jgi:hypothetical protein